MFRLLGVVLSSFKSLLSEAAVCYLCPDAANRSGQLGSKEGCSVVAGNHPWAFLTAASGTKVSGPAGFSLGYVHLVCSDLRIL